MTNAKFTEKHTDSWRVAVLAGGDSAEREISLLSGEAVAGALSTAGHRVELLDPRDLPVEQARLRRFDMVFLALHGTGGEDGAIQQRLDALHVPYTGSGVAASARAFHKLDAKRRFLSAHLPTPGYAVVPRFVSPSAALPIARSVGFPLAVKPEAQGSSLGVSIIEDPAELPAAMALAREFDDCLLFERAIPGDEWTVPVLDDIALPPIRITTPHAFFNFAAKYQDEETRYDVMLDSHHGLTQQIRQLAVQACQVLGCRGMSRVDLRVDPAGQPWLLEVNTLPGMTGHSLVPKSAAGQGWSMSRLCEETIASAWRGHLRHERLRAS